MIKSKVQMDAPIFGKPNLIINTQGMKFGEFINNSLKTFTPQELIEMAEAYSQNTSAQSVVMKKIFDQIEKEKNENEFNRTMIQNRTEGFNKTLNDFSFNLNSTGAVRILDRIDSSSAGDSYLNRVKKLNKTHLA
jgi:hypothetical protein